MQNSLFQKNFNLLVIGQIVSVLGASILKFTLSTYVLDITGKADVFAFLIAISTVPNILLSPIGGAIADRFNRRNLMVIFDFTSCLIVFAFIVLLYTNNMSIFVIGLVMTLLSTVSAMYQPTVQASIPLLAPAGYLEKANGIVSGIGALSNLAGPVLGGVLYHVVGIEILVLVSCTAFFCSAIMELFIEIPYFKQVYSGSIFTTIIADLKIGFRYMLEENRYILKSVVLATGLNFILTPFFIVGVPYILRITMQSSDAFYGICLGIVQLSSIVGALLTGTVAKRMQVKTLYRQLLFITVLIVPTALSVSTMGLSLDKFTTVIIFLACIIPIAMIMTIVSIFVITIVQKQTPNHLLGKILAIITSVAQCAAPIGQIVYGVLFTKFSTQIFIPIIIMGLGMVALTVVAKVMLKNERM